MMDTTQFTLASRIIAEFENSIQVKLQVIDSQVSTLQEITGILIRTLNNGKKVILFGNGGSAADAQHFAAELVSRFRRKRRALPALALTTDTSILTSIGNDFGFNEIFSRQVEALGETGDVVIGISTSGNSSNVLEGIETARGMGMTTVGFTGMDGGQLKNKVDFCFQVPSANTARIQEAHITAVHAMCELIDREFCERETA